MAKCSLRSRTPQLRITELDLFKRKQVSECKGLSRCWDCWHYDVFHRDMVWMWLAPRGSRAEWRLGSMWQCWGGARWEFARPQGCHSQVWFDALSWKRARCERSILILERGDSYEKCIPLGILFSVLPCDFCFLYVPPPSITLWRSQKTFTRAEYMLVSYSWTSETMS